MNYLHHSAPIAEALSNSRQVSETNLSAPIAEALNQEIISATNVVQNFENPSIEPKLSLRNTDTFYSNAEYAVRNIKQEKATPEERRATLVEATEDVARDDQFFILNGMEMAEKKKIAEETVSPKDSDHPAAISSATGAKILNNLDNLVKINIKKKQIAPTHLLTSISLMERVLPLSNQL